MEKKQALLIVGLLLLGGTILFLQNFSAEEKKEKNIVLAGKEIPGTEYILGRLSAQMGSDGTIVKEVVYLYPRGVTEVVFPESPAYRDPLPKGTGRAIKIEKGVMSVLPTGKQIELLSVTYEILDGGSYGRSATFKIFS